MGESGREKKKRANFIYFFLSLTQLNSLNVIELVLTNKQTNFDDDS